MRTILVAIALACSLAVSAADPAATPALAGLSERLRALAADTTRSHQWLLRDATHAVRSVAVDRPWSEIEPELRKQGLRADPVRTNQHTSAHRYVVTAEGWRAGGQGWHALFLEFTVDRRDPAAVASAKPDSIMSAEAGLLVQPDRPYAEVLARDGYPEGSVLARGLRLPQVTATAERHPVLARLELTYDFIRDHNADSWPQGFCLELTFTDAPQDNQRGERLHFTIASGLDSPQDPRGVLLQQPFTPQDTLAEFRSWGGSEWHP